MRWTLGVNSKSHSVVAGLLAGASVGFYRNTTLILYLAWKTLEVLYYEGIEAGYLTKIPGFASILYSLSTAVLFHAGIFQVGLVALRTENINLPFFYSCVRTSQSKTSLLGVFVKDNWEKVCTSVIGFKLIFELFPITFVSNRIGELNRVAFDVIGTQSSKMLPNYKPSYQTEYISDAFKSWLQNQSKI